jgi:hypothetical protein
MSRKKLDQMSDIPASASEFEFRRPRWVKVLLGAGALFVIAWAFLHLVGRGLGGHVH